MIRDWLQRDRRKLFRQKFFRRNAERRAYRACRSAHAVFQLVQLGVPKRLSREEIGDALEVIHQLVQVHASAWKIYLKIATTVGWLALNVIREVSSALLGRRSA